MIKQKTKNLFLLTGLILSVPAYAITTRYINNHYSGIRTTSSLGKAHTRALTSFMEGDNFGVSRFKQSVYWNDMRVSYNGKRFVSKTISLIGLTPEYGEHYYPANHPDKKSSLLKKSSRQLTVPELETIKQLRKNPAFAEVPQNEESYITHILAPIPAKKECLKCHDVEPGELLGAFDYHLIEIEE